MLEIQEVMVKDPDFIGLVRDLDQAFFDCFGVVANQYAPNNRLDTLQCAVVAYLDGQPVGCGGLRPLQSEVVEIKRVFVQKEYRRQEIAKEIMKKLEQLARNLGYIQAVLETGKALQGAVALYEALGYQVIDSYGPYAEDDCCVCFGKPLL